MLHRQKLIENLKRFSPDERRTLLNETNKLLTEKSAQPLRMGLTMRG